MKQGAITSPVTAVTSGSTAAGPCPRSTHLYAGRVPEFAQAQWLAVQRAHLGTEGESVPTRSPRRVPRIHTYAVLEQGLPVVLFFFRIEKDQALVWHEPAQESGEELQAFRRHVFRHFPAVRQIAFVAGQRFIQPRK